MHRIKVEVRGELSLERTFWEDASEADKDNYPGVVAPDECLYAPPLPTAPLALVETNDWPSTEHAVDT
jgi:hypothetical protein